MKKIIIFIAMCSLAGCGRNKIEKECDLSKFNVGLCVMWGKNIGSRDNKDMMTLIKNGNYTYSSRWEGEKCFVDIHVDGMVNGNSYKKTKSCDAKLYSPDLK